MIPYGIQTEVQVVDTMSCYMQTVHRHNKLFHRRKKNDGNNFFFLNAFTFVVTPDRKVQAKVRAQVSQHMHTKPYNLLFGKVDTCQKLANQFSS